MSKRKKLIIFGVIALCVVGIILLKNKPKVVEVRAVSAESVVVKKTVSASGIVTSKSEANMSLPTVGQLANVYVEKGQNVTAGQLLANVYNYDSSQSAQAAKDARDVTKKDLELYQATYQNNQEAVGGKNEYQINVKRLEELQSRAEATYQSALGSLSKTILYAPFAATVVDILFQRGEVVSVGSAIIKLADLNNLLFEVNVDQEDFGSLKQDQLVEITLDSYDKTAFQGKVVELPKYAKEDTSEFEVKISVTAPNDRPILLGMKGDASIIIEQTPNAVNALPFDVIFFDKDSTPFVWIVQNGKLAKLKTELGLEGDIYSEVKSDLTNTQIVLPTDPEKAQEGLKVNFSKK